MQANQYVNEKHLHIAPDIFSSDGLKNNIENDFIISRKPNGEIKSLYADNVWDFTAYSAYSCKFTFHNNRQHILFPSHTKPDLIGYLTDEMKRITLLLMYAPEIRCMQSRGLRTKIQSFSPTFTLLRQLTKAAANLNITLNEAAGNKQFYVALCTAALNLRSHAVGGLMNLIMQLNALNESGYHDVPVIIAKDTYEHFFKLVGNIQKRKCVLTEDRFDRTPLIPSRILSNLLVGSMKYIKAIEPYLDKLTEFFQEYQTNPNFWGKGLKDFKRRNNPHEFLWNEKKIISPKDAIAKYELLTFIEQFPICNIQSEYHLSILIGHLSRAQSAAKLLFHAYSGMRSHEVMVIPFNTLEKLHIQGLGDVPFLRSFTSKIGQDNYSKPTYWVTSPELERVIPIAQKIAKIAAIRSNANFSKDANFPLFPSLSAFLANKENHTHYDIPLIHTTNSLFSITSILNDIQITEEDLQELEVFDMFRDWRSEKKFSLGSNWPVTSHQFRRSLAVYAARSGLVSLPSLSTHFKHMTLAMTALYAENSAFAVNMIDVNINKTHREQKLFVDEFVSHQRLNQAINFDQKVIESSSRLTGGVGSHIQRLKDKENLPIWLTDRAEREKRAQDGRLHYRETMVGGCMNPAPCNKAGLGGVTACIGCEFSIFDEDFGEKDQAYKESLQLSLEYMEPNTPAYKAVVSDLERISLKQLNTEEEL
jgi:hypothetical protein